MIQGSERWLFIVGCYNSGTTLLEQMLRRHPDIAGLPAEGQFLTDVLVTPRDVGLPRLWAMNEVLFRMDPQDADGVLADQVYRDWCAVLDHPTAAVKVEKSPTNIVRMAWLQRNFPHASFLHLVRNGYVVAAGIRDKVYSKYGDRPELLRSAAKQWRRSAEVWQQDRVGLIRSLEVRYEDLVADPLSECARIFDFIGLHALDEATLLAPYRVHGEEGTICNKNDDRFDSLSEGERLTIYDEAAEMLALYNYI